MKIPPPVADLYTDVNQSLRALAKQTSFKNGRDCRADKSARNDVVNRQLNIRVTRKPAFTLA
ncbi:MAG: hypothetical protein LUG16_05825, partial [Candidatus Gastranaerophilales bacterium]|nr:hypothetical protein [Candidatus Gastranaerophilales bacterium]